MSTRDWFAVDRRGLAKLLDARGKERVILELVQNAFDANGATEVCVSLETIERRGRALLRVTDNSPVGFANLEHAYTLFAESNRKADPEKRGRFNLGEKLVLALCESAEITSISGAWRFDATGRHRLRKHRLDGSEFCAVIPMTRDERLGALDVLRRVIPPSCVAYHINGDRLDRCVPVAEFTATLPTEYADGGGVLRRSERQGTVEAHEPDANAAGWLYEMGIPVQKTGDRYSYNVMQKMPLGFSRDGASPIYLERLRAEVLVHTVDLLTPAEAMAGWVDDALENFSHVLDDHPETVRKIIELRHGKKVVIFDPSDVEASHIAMSKGYEVISGGSYTGPQWETIRGAGAMLPAGRVTASAKPFSPDGRPLTLIAPEDESPWMHHVRGHAQLLMTEAYGLDIEVHFTDERKWHDTAGKRVAACYGGRVLTINAAWVLKMDIDTINGLLIHELAHEKGTHLDASMLDAACHLGTTLARMYRNMEVPSWPSE